MILDVAPPLAGACLSRRARSVGWLQKGRGRVPFDLGKGRRVTPGGEIEYPVPSEGNVLPPQEDQPNPSADGSNWLAVPIFGGALLLYAGAFVALYELFEALT